MNEQPAPIMRDVQFGDLAASYDTGFAGRASRKFYDLVQREVRTRQDTEVLDVGCGTGALLGLIARTTRIVGYGVDVEPEMIRQAKKRHPQMTFALAPCDHLPFDDARFDVVIACMAFHHFASKDGFAAEAARVLKPGGILCIADPRLPWPIRPAMNGILRLARVNGEFFTPQQIETRFAAHGFTSATTTVDAYAQLVTLHRAV